MNENDKTKFKTDMGINATVQRFQATPEAASIPNRMLVDLAQAIQETESYKLSGYKYMGSAAVHIYAHELLNQLDFVSQTMPLEWYRCPQPLASRAFDDLLGTLKVMYGNRRPKLRSGF